MHRSICQYSARSPVPFHRFEDIESHYLTPHLSTGKAPVIDG